MTGRRCVGSGTGVLLLLALLVPAGASGQTAHAGGDTHAGGWLVDVPRTGAIATSIASPISPDAWTPVLPGSVVDRDGAPAAEATLPAARAYGLGRGATIGAIVGGVVLGTYGAIWYDRECEGDCRAPGLQGALVGGAVGAIGGILVGGLWDRLTRSW